ncbi:hypothetical protein ACFLZX_03840 [Nanoarchaeota archaeon]
MSGKKAKQQRKIEKEDQGTEKKGISRGTFLKGGAGLAILTSSGYFAFQRFSEGDYSFLNRDPVKLSMNRDEIEESFVPVGPLDRYTPGNPEFEEVKSRFESKNGRRIENCNHLYAKQYVIPDEERYNRQVRSYLEKAVSFMESRIMGLEKFPLQVVPVMEGDNFKTDFLGKTFIGLSRILLEDLDIGGTLTPAGISVYHGGAFSGQYVFESNQFDDWWAYVPNTGFAITAPFSEFLAFTTGRGSSQAYLGEKRLDHFIAEETITEALSYHLSHEIVRELGIPDGKKVVEFNFHFSRKENDKAPTNERKYDLVPKGIIFVAEHGIQETFDRYMDDPKRTIQEIRNVS